VPAILSAYQVFPGFIKSALCSVQSLYIEKKFFGTAWSAPVDEDRPQDMLLGLNQRELDAQLKLEPFLSWFEQLSFGGATDFKVLPHLPTVTVNPHRWKQMTFLVDTLAHEAGHLLDYKNRFNSFICDIAGSCQPAPGSWTEISWLSESEPLPENDFAERKLICINNCQSDHLDPQRADQFYTILHQSGFVSQLAAINSMEDFAETFSLYVKLKYLGQKIEWNDAKGNVYDGGKILNSRPLQQKLKYLESIGDLK
jgi:hypothetical protein